MSSASPSMTDGSAGIEKSSTGFVESSFTAVSSMRGIASGTAYSRRVMFKQLRAEATTAVDGVISGAAALNRTAYCVSRLTVLVATIAVAALGVAVVALLYAVNREASRETHSPA